MPDKHGIEPEYQQKRFKPETGLQRVISPDGCDGSLPAHQYTYLYQLLLNIEDLTTYELVTWRFLYIHVAEGQLSINGESLNKGDGAAVKDVDKVKFVGNAQSKTLIFDLP